MNESRILLTVLIGLALLSACSSGATSQPSQPSLEATAWVLTSLPGQSALVDPAPTLSFANGRASGNGSCNSFGGQYTASGDKLTFGALMSTRMACSNPGVMQQEASFFKALTTVAAYRLEGKKLMLYTAEGASVAEFLAKP